MYDWSGRFTVREPYLTLTSPNGGELWRGCESKNISWLSGGTSGTVRVEYSLDSGATWIFISNRSGSNFNWSLPTKLSGANAFIRVSDASRNLSDQSDSKFTIVPNSDIIVTSPLGGEEWEASTTNLITWVDNGVSRFRVRYSTNDGLSYSYVTSNTYANSVNWSVPNNPGVNYKIKVEDYYNSCKYDESDSVFEVTPPTPTLTLTAPNGANTLYQGQNYTVRWSSSHLTSPYVRLDYSLDSGLTWNVISNITNNDGSEVWSVPNVSTEKALVRVSEYGNASMYDISNANFFITPSITLLSPNGNNGQVNYRGCTVTSITWKAGGTSNRYNIAYTLDGGTNWTTINSNFYSSSSNPIYNWTMPNTGSAKVKVRVRDRNDASKSDESDNPFAISLPLKLNTANNGETYYVGDTVLLDWTSNGTSNYYNIDYSTNGGSTWTNIAFNFNTSGNTYQWIVPGTVTNNAKIRITDNIANCKQTQSVVAFKIVAGSQKITVNQPSGGEFWNGCTQQQIRWTDSGNSAAYKIEYSSNAGLSWTTIQNAYGSATGTYDWNVPSQVGSQYLIRVSDASDATKTDQSDSTFKVGVAVTPTITAVGVTTICSGSSVTLTADRSTGITWYPGGMTTQTVNVTTPGNYYVIATDSNSCSVQSNSIPVTAGTPPAKPTLTASGPVKFCLGGSVILSTNQTSGIEWYPGGQTSQTITATQGGAYTVTYTDGSGCSSTSDPLQITTNTIPAINRSSAGVCLGDSLVLSSSSSSGNVWFPTGDTTQTIKVSTNGNYKVQVTDADNCVSTSNEDTVLFLAPPAKPIITALGSTSFCKGESVQLKASPSNNVTWSNGIQDSVITVDSAASITVKYTNAGGCASESNPINISLLPEPSKPLVTLVGDSVICSGDSVSLASNTVSNFWSDSSTSNTITVKQTGYYATTTTGSNGCKSTSVPVLVTVNPSPSSPVINASGNTTFCTGDSVLLISNQPNGNKWSTGDSSTSILVKNAGSYTVDFTNQFGCTSSSQPANVVVNNAPAKPLITNSGLNQICVGDSVTLSSSFGGTVQWSTGESTNSITVKNAGNYSVTAVAVNGCSTTSDFTSIGLNTIPQTPSITRSDTNDLCVGDSILLFSSSATGNVWSTGDTTSSIIVSTNGTYQLHVKSNSGCESGTVSEIVSFNSVPSKPSIMVSGDTVLCSGDSVTLSTNASNVLWSNGSTASSINVKTSGQYTVSVGASSSCGSTSNPVAVQVNAQPAVPTILVSGDTTFCSGDSVQLTSSVNAGLMWSTGATSSSIVVKNTGSYSVKTTNQFGCDATSMPTNITVNARPAAPVVSANGSVDFCDGESVLLISSSPTNNLWTTGDTTNTVVVSASGNYAVTLNSATGCSSTSNSIMVNVRPQPTKPVITVNGDTSFCSGDSVVLSSTINSGLLWSTGDTTNSIIVRTAGTYGVKTTNTNGCEASAEAVNISVFNSPSAPVISANGSVDFCDGGSVLLTSSALTNNNWTNGDTTNSISVTATGNYAVSVITPNGCSATSNSIMVNVKPHPTNPIITVNGDTSFCSGDSVVLSSSVNSGILWSSGDTTNSIVVKTAGTYDVKATNSVGCEAISDAVSIAVFNSPTAPVVTANGSIDFCVGDSVLLSSTALSNNTWTSGDTSNTLNVKTTGNYAVSVSTSNGCSATSNSIFVNVRPEPAKPLITVNGDTSFCSGDSVVLSSSINSGLLWSSGDTTNSIVVKSAGTYDVQTTNSSGCESTSEPVSISVFNAPAVPVITANSATTFCDGGSVLLSSSAPLNNTWSSGDTSSAITVKASGSYSVVVQSANGCESSSLPTIVNVNPRPVKPIINLIGDSTFCAGDSVTLVTNYSSGIVWSSGDTTTSVTVKAAGIYSVQHTDMNGCVSTSDARAITVYSVPAVPVISASGPVEFCAGNSVTLNSSSAADNVWSTGDTNNSISVSTTGNVNVRVVNANGCEAISQNLFVKVNQLSVVPSISVIGDTTFCSGDSVTLVSSLNSGILWSTGDTTASIVRKVSGTVSLTYTDTNSCSPSSSVLQITSDPTPVVPTILASGATTFCAGNSITLNSSSASNNKWSTNDSTAAIQVNANGNYSVTTYNQFGCEATSQNLLVTVNPVPALPSINASGATTICQGDSVILSSSNLNGNFWSTTDTANSITVKSTGVYSLKIVDANSCESTLATQSVLVNPVPSAPIVSANGPTGFCQGDSVVLTSSAQTGNNWSQGDTVQSITVKTSGTYSVKLINTIGCEAISNSISVSVGNLPSTPVISAIGNTEFCAGDSVTLVSSASVGSRWSTGDTVSSIVVKSPGIVSLGLFDNGCLSNSTSESIKVNANPSRPLITFTGDTAFCPGDSVQLHSSYANGNTWSHAGGNAVSIVVKSSGSYQVTHADSNGCRAVSNPLAVRLFPAPNAPFVSPGGSVEICAGDDIVLSSDIKTGLSWSNDQSPADTQLVNTAGVFSVNHTDHNGCAVSSNQVIVSIISAPAPSTISKIGQDLVSTTASSYQWYLGGVPQAGEIGSLIRPSQNGVYQVETSNSSGCTVLSEPYTYTSVGVADASNGWVQEFSIYPNPSNGVFGMTLNLSELQEFELRIFSFEGKVVYQENIKPTTTQIARNYLLQELPSGMYQFELSSTKGVYKERLIIQR